MIRAYPILYFFGVKLGFELGKIQSKCAGIGAKHVIGVLHLAPYFLLAIKQVVHLPKMSLQSGGLSRLSRFLRVFVLPERKVAKNDPQIGMILKGNLIQKCRDTLTRRTFEIAKLFERNRRIGVTANVHFRSVALSGHGFVMRNGQKMWPLCPV